MKLFAVLRSRGPAFDSAQPLEQQQGWSDHAAFMNGLVSEGFVVIGGPLEGTSEVLLIVRARDESEARSRLAEDPWSRRDLLRLERVAPWTLRLGSLSS